MKVSALDTLLAAKVINVAPGLRHSERKVGLVLIEHFNRRTGQCDPGIARIAALLGCCTRTVIRATSRLEKVGLFRKVRHGGYSNRNSYEPNWVRFAEQERSWKASLQTQSRSRRTPVSPAKGQCSHLIGDARVTQTYPTNLSIQTYVGCSTKNQGNASQCEYRSQEPSDVANVQAERRWSDELLHRYGNRPVTYAEIVELIDEKLRLSATEAERARRGAGLLLIERTLKLAAG